MADRALKRLYLTHKRSVQDYLTRKLRDPVLAADLTQDAFVRIAESGRLDTIGNARSYLYRTAHNLAIDHVRKPERRYTEHADDERIANVPEDIPAVDDTVAARQTLERLHDVVGELPERTRHVFVLNKIEGLSYAETADRLGISESSVQKHLRMALAHAIKRLKLQ
ncbi:MULTISPECIES: RNA polymerase sigma factor [Novosphingobium]|uniref:RNA polymerase sigma factor n=1 Tax=unclassified Novosphingobium TaxID=2644732 RepID=UPI0006C86247|nr:MULTISPECIES: RNA polymerase sigma factor [unclassified Novosphingobium]KPH65940.1 RNA polymerase sigma70 [Novosphingobium sp. ST904]MPS70089.1 RNA polymerase sigma factor [Novosphingobium sp.]TCM38772.1 RNA polymerase sigma-70 factor (ECF subfamily) [Novosphingobium sp. ST904]WRT95794.1 RNA polymerase sigma factor [Novosphingobium sp. RL4]